MSDTQCAAWRCEETGVIRELVDLDGTGRKGYLYWCSRHTKQLKNTTPRAFKLLNIRIKRLFVAMYRELKMVFKGKY